MVSAKSLLAGLALVARCFAGIALTPGSGEWNVSISHVGFVNTDFPDVADVSHERRVMTSMFYPIYHMNCTAYCNPAYMPDETARVSNEQFFGDRNANVFEQAEIKTCCNPSIELDPANYSVVVIEPAYGTSRFLYQGIAQEIASHGFAVLTMDHPYDSSIMEYTSPNSDDHLPVYSKHLLDPFAPLSSWNSTINDLITARASDINFVISQLSSALTTSKFVPYANLRAFNTSRIAIYGHGLGGSVASYLTFTDPRRYIQSINMAGTPPIPDDPITLPEIVFFGRHPGGRREDDIHWPTTWSLLQGLATEFDMQDAGIFDYSDLPAIADLVGKGRVPRGLGGIKNWKAFGITAQFCRAYASKRFGRSQDNWNELHELVGFFGDDMVPYPGVKGRRNRERV